MKNLAEFDFSASPVNEGLVRELHEAGFLATQRNAVLIGGTGTGKSHLAIAIGNCVRNGARVRFFTAVDLVNQLEAEARAGKAGKLADQLVRGDLVILDELGYLPFPVSGGQMLFHLISPALRAHLDRPVDQSRLRRMAAPRLMIRPGWDSENNRRLPYPAGAIPRLLTIYLCREAKRADAKGDTSGRIDLGHSLRAFMHEPGLRDLAETSGIIT